MVYAVVEIGGNQYKISPGDTLVVDKLEHKVGEIVSYPSLLVVDGSKVTVGKDAEKIQVKGKVTSFGRGDKIYVERFRAKSRYRRRRGFRAETTSLLIESVGSTVHEKPAKTAKPKAKAKKS